MRVQELSTFMGRLEATIKSLEDENKNLKEENDRLRGMVEGDDNENQRTILKCIICMEFKEINTFLCFSPCGHMFCQSVSSFLLDQ